MKLVDVNLPVVRRAIESLGRVFHTRDVSEHPDVVRAHSALVGERAYHSVFGRVLSQNRGWLTIRLDQYPAGRRGARWMKI